MSSKTASRCNNTLIVSSLTLGVVLAAARPILVPSVKAANLYAWTRQEDTDRLGGAYTSAAVSADGSHLILGVTNGGENTDPFQPSPLYISSNYGATWENVALEINDEVQHHWSSVDVSNDGQVMVATSDWGNDFVNFQGVDGITVMSDDGGATWTDITPGSDNDLDNIVVSGDGSKIVAIDGDEEDLRITEDGGDNWTSIEPIADGNALWNLKSVSISDNGSKILVGGENGMDDNTNLFISDDSGATWTDISPNHDTDLFPDQDEQIYDISHDLSANGDTIVATAFGYNGAAYDDVFVSHSDGVSWTVVTPDDELDAVWTDVAVSDDGSAVSVLDDQNDKMYLSTDTAATWNEENPGEAYEDSNSWEYVDLNEDGSRAIAGGDNNAYILGEPNEETPSDTTTVSLTDAEGGKTITLTTPDGTTITCHSAVKESGLAANDGIYAYPLGLVDFCFSGAGESNQVSLVFVTDLKPNQVAVRKYNPTTKQYATVTGASVTETTQGGSHALLVTYTITDNGPLDTDPDTGEIADPVGLGTLDVAAPNTGFGQ